MLALLPTKRPAPMIPPIEISATCRERKVRLSVGAAGGETAINEQFTQMSPRAVILRSRSTRRSRMKSPLLAYSALALLLLGCQGPPEPTTTPAAPNASQAALWDAFRDEYIEGYFRLNPSYAVYQG